MTDETKPTELTEAEIKQIVCDLLAHPDPECTICSIRDCPGHEPYHYSHHSCPHCGKMFLIYA
jgi:predicted RNA-binding Zn-ribbon protein involved in translation (DUF1610 family)